MEDASDSSPLTESVSMSVEEWIAGMDVDDLAADVEVGRLVRRRPGRCCWSEDEGGALTTGRAEG